MRQRNQLAGCFLAAVVTAFGAGIVTAFVAGGVTVFGATLRHVNATESQALFGRSQAVVGKRTWSREDLYDRGRIAGDTS